MYGNEKVWFGSAYLFGVFQITVQLLLNEKGGWVIVAQRVVGWICYSGG